MNNRVILSLATLLALQLAGCGGSLPVNQAPTTVASAEAVVVNSGLNGTKSIRLNVLAPREAGYGTLAVVHKWVDEDIHEYRATLKVWNGTAYVNLSTPLSVTIPRKGEAPKTQAVFTKLKQGYKYQVSLVAMGNEGGTAASTALNSTAATGEYDFSASQNVEDTQSANLQITFDAVAFSGSGSATISTPENGTYANPGEPETGEAR